MYPLPFTVHRSPFVVHRTPLFSVLPVSHQVLGCNSQPVLLPRQADTRSRQPRGQPNARTDAANRPVRKHGCVQSGRHHRARGPQSGKDRSGAVEAVGVCGGRRQRDDRRGQARVAVSSGRKRAGWGRRGGQGRKKGRAARRTSSTKDNNNNIRSLFHRPANQRRRRPRR